MKLTNHLLILIMATLFVASGCASSYKDRLDALNPPEDETTEDVSTVPEDDGALVSRDAVALSGACIISADCASTQHCELGKCVSKCSHDTPCPDDQTCSKRGRCVSDAKYLDTDPAITATPPVDWYVDEHVVSLNPGQSSASFNIKVKSGGALKYRVQVEPESIRDAVVVSSQEGMIASGGSKALSVSVDRQAFDDGDHRVSINVISDGGQQNVIYEFSNGLSGRYGGFVGYTDPGLGRIPIVVDVEVGGAGQVTGRVVTSGSLLFPEERTITGQYDAEQKTMLLSTSDLIQTGSDYDPFERDIGREIYLFGEINEQRVIKGTFEEIVYGLLPQTMNVSGEFYLTRVTTDIGTISVGSNQNVQLSFPPVSSLFHSSNCDFSNLPDPEGEDPNITCDTELAFNSNMIECSIRIRAQAFSLGSDFSGIDTQGDPFVDFGLVEECKKDVASQGTNACVDIDDLICLRGDQQHYLIDATAQDAEYEQYFEDLKGIQRVYSFIGNDLLKDAYRTGVEEVSNPLSTELSRLENALEEYEKAEQAFFSAMNIKLISKSTSQAISANDFDLFRVPLQYIRSSQSALARLVSLTLRRDLGQESKKATLRARTQAHARAIYLEGLALARLIATHGGAFENELAQIADELRAVGYTVTMLDGALNPLGFSDDYVPFIYDSADMQHTNNFAQLSYSASNTVSSAVQKAEVADNAVELMEVKTQEIEQRIQDIELNFESEVYQICGINSIELIGDCGESGGELALVYNDIEDQYLEIESIQQQIMDINEMVKIKRDSALQIMQAKQTTLNFLQASGAQMSALDMAAAEVQAAMLRKQGMFGSIGGFFKGVSSIGIGMAMGVVGNDPFAIAGSITGGFGSVIDSGMSAIMGAQSAGAAEEIGRLNASKTHLDSMRQIRIKEEEMQIAAIQAAEAVKILLIEMASLNLDLEKADVRLQRHVIRANNLLQRVDFLFHQRDVLIAQQLESVNNPLSNLSFRLKRDHAVLMAVNEFEKALSDVYLAARGLEHELNVEMPQIESQLFQTNSAAQLQGFLGCLNGWYDDYRIAFGSPHDEVIQISLREDILGFSEPVTDEVTGEIIEPEEIFRRVLFDPKYITQSGRVEFPFVTSIVGSNKNFSTLVCNDRIKSIKVMLVGDFLGDNEATVMLRQEGDSYLRDCSSEPETENDILNTYHLDKRNALIQAGVNSFGLASPNYDLTGRSVASDRWVLVIPTGSEAPNNSDVDFLNIDDVVIEITHTARTLNSGSPTNVFGQCNI